MLIYLFPNKFLLKKDKVAKLGLVKFNFSCDWQLVRKPFERAVKFLLAQG